MTNRVVFFAILARKSCPLNNFTNILQHNIYKQKKVYVLWVQLECCCVGISRITGISLNGFINRLSLLIFYFFNIFQLSQHSRNLDILLNSFASFGFIGLSSLKRTFYPNLTTQLILIVSSRALLIAANKISSLKK